MSRNNTRQQLILAAERLFAKKGIEGTSLREINLAAGQKNTAATHYHFGSKDALILAILDYRRPALEKRLNEMLSRLEAEDKIGDLRSMVEAMVYPLADLLDPAIGDGQALLFLERLWLNPPVNSEVVSRRYEESVARIRTLLIEAMSNVPKPLVHQRLFLITRHMASALAEFQRSTKRNYCHKDQLPPLSIYLSSLVDSMVAYLSAPLSEITFEKLASQQLQSA